MANGIVVHNCRSALIPIPNTRPPSEDMIFENRDFSGTLDDPNAVKKVFDDIEKFNSKYRVSGYVIDKDLSTRIMMEKGAYVSVVSDIPVNTAITETYTVEELIKSGGSEWKKDDMHRIYFNNLDEMYGLELTRFKSGQISTAYLDGEKISNNKARELYSKLTDSKLWYDVKTGEFQNKGLSQELFDKFVKKIKSRI